VNAGQLCPDFVLELRSPSDRVTDVPDKMVEYLASGVHLGWLIEPIAREVHVYRQGQAVERHEAPVLSGLTLRPADVWH
jgi:Uma2 family endonuclease